MKGDFKLYIEVTDYYNGSETFCKFLIIVKLLKLNQNC